MEKIFALLFKNPEVRKQIIAIGLSTFIVWLVDRGYLRDVAAVNLDKIAEDLVHAFDEKKAA